MPIFEYRATENKKSCDHCREGFEFLHKTSGLELSYCPQCGSPVSKQISAPSVGTSKSGADDRAKAAGFTKLKRLGKGEYEKQF